jgi:CHAP domain
MSVEQILARIDQLETALASPGTISAAALSSTPSAAAQTGTAPSATSFASTLVSALAPAVSADAVLSNGDTTASADGSSALASLLPTVSPSTTAAPLSLSNMLAGALAPTAAAGATADAAAPGAATGNPAIVAIAQSQLGVTEQPPGSNDSPAIAGYRTATAGSVAGEPWCAYFASWVARQAGEPLGAQGQGFGAVADVWTWAQQTGRAVANGPGVVPAPGDLIVFGDHHIGIVDQVLPSGQIETVEGNYNGGVSLVTRGAGEATGYVRMS